MRLTLGIEENLDKQNYNHKKFRRENTLIYKQKSKECMFRQNNNFNQNETINKYNHQAKGEQNTVSRSKLYLLYIKKTLLVVTTGIRWIALGRESSGMCIFLFPSGLRLTSCVYWPPLDHPWAIAANLFSLLRN